VRRLALLLVPLAACTSAPSRAPAAEAVPALAAHHVRFEPAGAGQLAPLVASFVTRAHAEGRTPLVYVGATWCEPCRYFHAAAERGDLDGELPTLALLELDLDRDAERIAAAGYGSRMIPLFAVPSDDGRAAGPRIEGSIYGPGSPLQIAPRLRAILPPPILPPPILPPPILSPP
jgi:thiol-disulfide isomerase/thioredoxin